MLADPEDSAVRAQVTGLLDKLAADPANGIERVLTHAEIARQGGFPDAAYFVAFRIGYESGGSLFAPLISDPSNLGMHGYLPDHPEMRSSFFLVGPQVPAARSLGEIDMRQIAPTLAKIMHVALKQAELGPVALPGR
jgi:hypothetical protein